MSSGTRTCPRPGSLVAVAVVLLLALAGCTTDGVDADVEVTLGEWFVRAVPDRPQAGDLRIRLVNEGGAHHSLTICESGDVATCEGDNVVQRYVDKPEEARVPADLPDETDAPILGADWSATLEATLAPGTYRLYCSIIGHPGRGMQTLVAVGGSSPDPAPGAEDG